MPRGPALHHQTSPSAHADESEATLCQDGVFSSLLLASSCLVHAALGTKESLARCDQLAAELDVVASQTDGSAVHAHDETAATVALIAASERLRVMRGSNGAAMGDAADFDRRRSLVMRAFAITAPKDQPGAPAPLQACVLRVLGQVLVARGCGAVARIDSWDPVAGREPQAYHGLFLSCQGAGSTCILLVGLCMNDSMCFA